MAAKYCICAICNKKFDRNAIQAVKHGARRYAHYDCYNEGELVPMEISAKNDPDLLKLKEYINCLYGDKANWVLINKQIKRFVNDNKFTYTGIYSTLQYFYEIQKNRVEESNGGIGIVEYVYEQAKIYNYNIWLAQQNTNKQPFISKVKEYIFKPSHKKGIKNKEIHWGEEE